MSFCSFDLNLDPVTVVLKLDLGHIHIHYSKYYLFTYVNGKNSNFNHSVIAVI